MKQMVAEIVQTVKTDYSNRHITIQEAVEEKKEKKAAKSSPSADKPKKRAPRKAAEKPQPVATASDNLVGTPCPLCGKGTIIKGNTAYGCSEWRNGCTFRKNFG